MVLRLPEYEGKADRRWTLAADQRGVALSLLSTDLEYYNGEVWWFPLNCDDACREKIAEFGLCQAGKSYDYWSLVKNMWRLVPVEMQKYFCSEYVFAAYRDAGLVTGEKAPRPSALAALPLYKEPVQLIHSILQTPPVVGP
jgi:hypothetical protein